MSVESDWTEAELEATVAAYLEILRLEEAGKPYSKSEIRRQLRNGPLARRTDGSVEYRMQNISHVMTALGQKRVAGYAPAANVGQENSARLQRIISALQIGARRKQDSILAEVIPGPHSIMGVKAVFGPISSHVLCFGGHGSINDKSYFRVAASAAQRAKTRPYVIAIGGGKNVQKAFEGRVVNVARLAFVYGLTKSLLSDYAEIERLARWPVAIALHDVWSFVKSPLLIDDLGFPDRKILSGAQDGIVHPGDAIERLWDALRTQPVRPAALPLPGNFYDAGAPTLVNKHLPTIPSSKSEEGKRVFKLQRAIERDPKMAKEAKRLNYARYGAITCEACGFAHSDSAMFDAHHPTPLAVGKRTTLPEHLLVLCPTCHRRAHRNAPTPLNPYTLDELKDWVASGRL
ncbi:MAG: HNH endonuclease [Proteobacteria bacterium]|nr:HNH endonuclease [Pseudomonadota bacterium]